MGQYLFSCHGNAVKEGLRLFICCFVETCSETEDRSFTHDLLCTCTLLQRSKTDVRVLTLHGFSNSTKIKKLFQIYVLHCYTFQIKYILSTIILYFQDTFAGDFLICNIILNYVLSIH
jgi:predicted transcriptional regulator